MVVKNLFSIKGFCLFLLAAAFFVLIAAYFDLSCFDLFSDCARRDRSKDTVLAFGSDVELKNFLNLEAVKAREEYIKANWIKIRDHPYLLEFISRDQEIPVHFALKNLGSFLFYISVVLFSSRVQPNLDVSQFYGKLIACSIISDMWLCFFACFTDVDSKFYVSELKSTEDQPANIPENNSCEIEAEAKIEDPFLKYLANVANGYNFLSLSMAFFYIVTKPDLSFSDMELIQLGSTLVLAGCNYYIVNTAVIPEISSKIEVSTETEVLDNEKITADCVDSTVDKQDQFFEAIVSLLLLVCE